MKQPNIDLLLSYNTSIECWARVRFNLKEYSVDIDLSEHSRLTEHVSEWIKLWKEEQKEVLSIWLMDRNRDVVALVDITGGYKKKNDKMKNKKRKKITNDSSTQEPKKKSKLTDSTALVPARDNTGLVLV